MTSLILFEICCKRTRDTPTSQVWVCVFSSVCGFWPEMMKTMPLASATLSFCSGVSAMQVVHLMPTTAAMIAKKQNKIQDNIRPRVPWTIPEDKDTTQDQVSGRFIHLLELF